VSPQTTSSKKPENKTIIPCMLDKLFELLSAQHLKAMAQITPTSTDKK
jgi:hypothetical protein